MERVIAELEAAIVMHAREPLCHDRTEETNEIENTLGVRIGEDDVAQIVSSRHIKEIEKKVSDYLEVLKEDWEELPQYFITSSENRLGRETLLSYIQEINDSIPKF